jgi:hypothetical protein
VKRTVALRPYSFVVSYQHNRKAVVYELFFTNLPQAAFTASDVVAFYLHRGAFETVLSDEDVDQ